MNIQITDSWLRDYLETDATPDEIQQMLSLCGPSIETVESIGNEIVYDIEITSNRIDMASVFGIAQEAVAILPQFGKSAQLKLNPLTKYTFERIQAVQSHQRPLEMTISDQALSPRYAAVVITDISMKQAPPFMKQRLEACGMQSINAVVDISNYLMLAIGQPSHIFDYKTIRNGRMQIRTSTAGERITTLDGTSLTLPGNDIVIEDAEGRLIDLCGIMGGKGSSVTDQTEELLLLVPTYDKRLVRKTSMKTGHRSVAATYFEKGTDPARIETGFAYALHLLQETVGGTVASEIIDAYPHPRPTREITISDEQIERLIGVKIPPQTTDHILTSLGFTITRSTNDLAITIPSYRDTDVEIPADIIEEVARVYGYHVIPAVLPDSPVLDPIDAVQQEHQTIRQIQQCAMHHGMHEIYTYSMVSRSILEKLGVDPATHLALKNPISEELTHMRTSLIPSLVQAVSDNHGRSAHQAFFEMTRVYHPQDGSLPNEPRMLGLIMTDSFFALKGMIETLVADLKISELSWIESTELPYGHPQMQATIVIGEEQVGQIATLRRSVTDQWGIDSPVTVAELSIAQLSRHRAIVRPYQAPAQTAIIQLNRTYQRDQVPRFADLLKVARAQSTLLSDCHVHSVVDDQLVIQYQFHDRSQNITEAIARTELYKIEEAAQLSTPEQSPTT